MHHSAPGLNPARLVRLMQAAIQRCRLDLGGAVVLTEAASGAYVVTPVLAALAGARQVYAMTRPTRYGSVEEISEITIRLACLAGCQERITIIDNADSEIVKKADIITNSGHVRPIDAQMIASMKSTAVVPLMFESWEFRPGDLDLEAARRRGVQVVGTNERHPDVDVFSFLGLMAVKLLADAAVAAYKSRILVLCNNPFAPYIERGLEAAGSAVRTSASLDGGVLAEGPWDAVLVALTPGSKPVIGPVEADLLAKCASGAVVAQFWGDLDRTALDARIVPYWPLHAPSAGHMGILPSGVGPEAIVRLQTGGLKAAEVAWRGAIAAPDHAFADVL
jgi:hypothetical protein